MRRLWSALHRTSPFGGRVVLTMATNLLLAAVGIATGVLAARLLGPQGRGELAAIQLWPSFIATVAMLGLPESLVYFTAQDPNRSGRHLGSVLMLALLASVPFMILGYFAIPFLLTAQPREVVDAARWYLLLIPLFSLVGMPGHSLRGRNDFVAWNVLRTAPNIGWLFVLCIAWVVGGAAPGELAIAFLAALGVTLVPVIYLARQRIPGPFTPELGAAPKLLRYGVPSALSSVPQTLNVRLDQMMIAALLPSETLGLYAVAAAWSAAALPLMSALGSVMLPRVAGNQTVVQRNLMFTQGSRLGILVGASMLLLLAPLTPLLIPFLFGREFSAAVPPALILLIATTLVGINSVLEEGLRGLGNPVVVMKAEIIGLGVNAAALLVLLQPLQLLGAAMAVLLASGSVTVVLLILATRLTACPLREMVLPRKSEIILSLNRLTDMVKNATAR